MIPDRQALLDEWVHASDGEYRGECPRVPATPGPRHLPVREVTQPPQGLQQAGEMGHGCTRGLQNVCCGLILHLSYNYVAHI